MQEDIEDGLNELVVRKRKGQIKIDFANIPVAYFLNKVFLLIIFLKDYAVPDTLNSDQVQVTYVEQSQTRL